MSVITSGSFAKALYPGVNAWYGEGYNEWATEYTDLFDTYKTTRAFEEDVGTSWFGLASVKTEGGPISYDSASQSFVKRYTPVVYGLGFVITREMVEDDLYDVIASKKAKALAFSMRTTKETVCADVYNGAFGTYTTGDGAYILSSAHVYKYSGAATGRNQLSTPADLSEAALEQAYIDIGNFVNDRGLRIMVKPQSLHISIDNTFEAERILKTTMRPGTADNDVNALRSMGMFPKGVKVNHYFTDSDAWFIRTNAPDGMKLFERRADEFTTDNDFDTENAKFKATGRYAAGCTEWRSLFGSAGA